MPAVLGLAAVAAVAGPIDREALTKRNSPHITTVDILASLTVGNGGFAYTADITGLQTFPEAYRNGVPLGTQSDWGWHSFANPDNLRPEEALKDYDFGRGRLEPYATQYKEPGRNRRACDWYRVNPHRLHLGTVGFAGLKQNEISDIDQTLDIGTGVIESKFAVNGRSMKVLTSCHPEADMVAATVSGDTLLPVAIRFPYPTGAHCDDGCDWNADDRHMTEIVGRTRNAVLLRHTLDSTRYYVNVSWHNGADFERTGRNSFTLTPGTAGWNFTVEYLPGPEGFCADGARDTRGKAQAWWRDFWAKGGVVDFSECTDPRAAELERRVALSQYLLAANCAGDTPPQETGLTYNSWFGKFHLEMIWWHQSHFPLWGHADLLGRTLPWYESAMPMAREIAARQGFDGVRWMKMTDPSGAEAPSSVGSFLIWQQPHLIYLAELMYRANPDRKLLERYYPMIEETAKFMASFADWDPKGNRYVLKGIIPAQETLRAAETVNPPFELAYWHFGLNTAQKWRERLGMGREPEWDKVIEGLSHLAAKDGLYLAAETAPQTYGDIRFTSDHMAVLAAVGILPESPLYEPKTMDNTFDWIYDNWNWDKTWGWDYPTTAMNAVRLGHPDKAVNALLMDKRTNTYLPNGHNCQDQRLRIYLPGNGGLLTTVALMCAGWDGCNETNPGFPKDGTWNVKWEGLNPLP